MRDSSLTFSGITIIGILCTTLPAWAGEYDPSPDHPFGRPHPDAAAYITDFAFAIGQWHCTNSWNGAENADQPTLDWSFNYALNGRAIEDYFEDSQIRGQGMRLYNSTLGEWNVVYMSMMPNFDNRTWVGGKQGDRMVLDLPTTRPNGETVIQRLSFYNIATDSFEWQGEMVSKDASQQFWHLGCTRK